MPLVLAVAEVDAVDLLEPEEAQQRVSIALEVDRSLGLLDLRHAVDCLRHRQCVLDGACHLGFDLAVVVVRHGALLDGDVHRLHGKRVGARLGEGVADGFRVAAVFGLVAGKRGDRGGAVEAGEIPVCLLVGRYFPCIAVAVIVRGHAATRAFEGDLGDLASLHEGVDDEGAGAVGEDVLEVDLHRLRAVFGFVRAAVGDGERSGSRIVVARIVAVEAAAGTQPRVLPEVAAGIHHPLDLNAGRHVVEVGHETFALIGEGVGHEVGGDFEVFRRHGGYFGFIVVEGVASRESQDQENGQEEAAGGVARGRRSEERAFHVLNGRAECRESGGGCGCPSDKGITQ